MTEAELRQTQKFKDLPLAEQQAWLREIREGKWDLESAPLPAQQEQDLIKQAQAGPVTLTASKKYGFGEGPPQRTKGYLEEVSGAFAQPFTQFKAPTWAETYLPESIVTKALSGLERGTRFGLGVAAAPAVAAGRVIEKASEEAPKLIGQEPKSSLVSRASGLGVELATGLKTPMPVPEAPPPVAGPARQRAVDIVNRKLLRVTPESQQAQQTARELGLPPPTIGESRASPGWSRVESAIERFPIGGGTVTEYREGQRAGTRRVAERMGERLGESRMGRAEAGQTIRDVSEDAVRRAEAETAAQKATQEAAAAAVAETRAANVIRGLGDTASSGDMVTATKTTLRQAERAARDAGTARYQAVEQAAGDAGPTLTATAQQAQALLTAEAELGALRRPGVTRAAGAAQDVAGTQTTVTGPGGTPIAIESLPRQLVEQYGLDTAQAVPLRVARELRSRIRANIRTAKTDVEKRQLREIVRALDTDINAWADTVPGDIGAQLREADTFWRTRVAEPFGEDSHIRQILDTTEPAAIEALLFNPKTAERTLQIKAELDRVDPEAWTMLTRRWGDGIMRKAIDPTTNQFSADAFVRELGKYPPDSLHAILGDRAPDVNRLMRAFQEQAAGPQARTSPVLADKIFRQFATAVPEVIVGGLHTWSQSELDKLRTTLGPQTWNNVAGAWWRDVLIPSAHSNQGVFSRSRFLSELGKIDKRNPDYLPSMLGADGYAELTRFRELLQRQENVFKLGDNPSGTGQSGTTVEQLYRVGQLAAGAGAVWFGQGNVVSLIGGSGILIGPPVLSRLLMSARGIRLLTEGMAAPQGSKAAQEAALRIGVFLSQQGGEFKERVEANPWPPPAR